MQVFVNNIANYVCRNLISVGQNKCLTLGVVCYWNIRKKAGKEWGENMLWLNMVPLHFLPLSLWNSLFLRNNLFGVHIHLFSPNSVLLLTCLSKLLPTDLCNNVWYCFRNAVSARGGGVSGPGNSNEEPVHWQRHAQSTTRGRPCQQVSNLCPSKGYSVVLTQGLYIIPRPLTFRITIMLIRIIQHQQPLYTHQP